MISNTITFHSISFSISILSSMMLSIEFDQLVVLHINVCGVERVNRGPWYGQAVLI